MDRSGSMESGRSWLRFLRLNQHVRLYVLAIFIGLLVAYGAIGFRELIDLVQIVLMGFSGEDVASQAANQPWWRIMIAPIIGGLVVAAMLRVFMKDHRALGIADVIAANAISNTRMSFRQGMASAVISATSMGAGASTGREGPIVHLGATLASSAAERMRLSPSQGRTLLGCGVAAAVAASFNAPIAGVFFALEVVLGHYALRAFAPIVMASVVGTLVTRAHYGNFPAFIIPEYAIVSFWEFPAFVLLGAVCAVAAILFTRSVFLVEDGMKKYVPLPRWSHPVLGGLLVGMIAVFYPHILGVGYEATDAALREQLPLTLMLTLIVLKTAATAISLGSGFGGGVFSPSLFVGAMTGSAYGIIASMVFPELAASHGLYAIVGMGALAGAVLGAPISTFLIVFELVADYELSIAVMVATATASLIMSQSYGRSFFQKQLERRGLDLRGGRAGHVLQTLPVGDVMTTDYRTVGEDENLTQLRVKLALSPHGTVFVRSTEGVFTGQIAPHDIDETTFADDTGDLIRVADIAHPAQQILFETDNLQKALSIMDVTHEDHIPVLDDPDSRQIVGILHHRDALSAYNRALLDERREEHGD
ncbi:MAG: chloride channel protein [Alphaproteobacteria bacterium]